MIPDVRSSEEEIKKYFEYFSSNLFLCQVLNSMIELVMILNKNRQIVFANRAFLQFLNIENCYLIAGKKPGEILNCAYPCESGLSCGTTEFCKQCGAKNAILNAQIYNSTMSECSILQKKDGNFSALDLRINATSFEYNNEQFVNFTCIDIQNEKRRAILERTFFHDILNLAGGLYGYAQLIASSERPDFCIKYKHDIKNVTESLVEEIKAQRDLLNAEIKQLAVSPVNINTIDLLNEIFTFYKRHIAAKDRIIVISPKSENLTIQTDKTLLRRVIGNMLKNALESVPKGETVTIGCNKKDNGIQFWVHNPTFMDIDVQLQLFKRSFTTKGKGRGIGTYSMKIFTEEYLKGKMSFESDGKNGTTFMAWLPF